MQPDAVQKISREVARSYLEMSGVRPSVKRQAGPGDSQQYLLTYRVTASLPGERSMNLIVRVVADEHGRILKMSTSR